MGTAKKEQSLARRDGVRTGRNVMPGLSVVEDRKTIVGNQPISTAEASVPATPKPQLQATSGGMDQGSEAIKPRSTEFVPAPCSSCTAIRPANTNYSEVYSVHRQGANVVRYCRCRFCGNTFKNSESLIQKQ